MPSYKITYFNGRGRAECARLCFALAGVAFEDKRVVGEEWAKLKPESKFGSLPELEVDGEKFGQSRALMFFLAREFGFYPEASKDKLAAEEIVFVVEDLVNALVKVMFCKEEEKEEKTKEFKETTLPKFLAVLEKTLTKNDSGKGFFVGKKVSVADIAVFDTLSGISERFEGSLDSCKALKGHVERFANIDNIKAYLAKRPVTNF